MPLGTKVGLSPGDFVLDGDPAPPPKKGAEPPIFGPCLLWSNGCMYQDTAWYGGRPHIIVVVRTLKITESQSGLVSA